MKTIDLPSGGWIGFQKWGLVVHWEGLGFYLGWFTDIDLVGVSITLLEWSVEDGSHIVPFRIQILYFLLALHMDSN